MLNILSLVIDTQVVCLILSLIGVYALIWWLSDNLKSSIQIIIALLRPFFQPEDDLPLKERFGSWAGKLYLLLLQLMMMILLKWDFVILRRRSQWLYRASQLLYIKDIVTNHLDLHYYRFNLLFRLLRTKVWHFQFIPFVSKLLAKKIVFLKTHFHLLRLAALLVLNE